MNKIIATLWALCTVVALAILGAVSVASPAQAGLPCDTHLQCGDIKHYSPDYGADGPILVTGNFGDPWSATQNVYEGNWSTFHDVDGFWVGAGETIRCRLTNSDGWINFTAYGWHKIHDTDDWLCVRGTS